MPSLSPIAQICAHRTCAPSVASLRLAGEAHLVEALMEPALGHAMGEQVGALVDLPSNLEYPYPVPTAAWCFNASVFQTLSGSSSR